ncbi:biotin-protein ligase [Fimicolochytrium jonesii]|uniref:biotin-protein ligase n=1 Tax=Fimicolochytrium jonesii TaxID=1396493 RepID=UPI0022FEF1B0|nr:biotin-protein ligase [Fimicolochytrium jonesii]KAI8818983.1 biotin-protein ligase [Fimicolochytrium jonesii]
MNVLVYTGPGTARGPVQHTLTTLRSLLSSSYDVIPVDSNTLLKEPWQHTAACLVIPGGRDLPYVEHLEPHGTKIVEDYVKNGGSYLGICAGAYFACKGVEFEVGRQGYEVVGGRELRFWPGIGKGSVTENFIYDSEEGARAVKVVRDNQFAAGGVEGAAVDLYVNGGPYFDLTNVTLGDSAHVLAWYSNDDGSAIADRPAIVECVVGKGKAILSGPHFEYQLVGGPKSGEEPEEVRRRLQAAEPQRASLTRDLLVRLGLRLNDPSSDLSAASGDATPKLSFMYLCDSRRSGDANEQWLAKVLGPKCQSGTVEDTANRLTFTRADASKDGMPAVHLNTLSISDVEADKPSVNIVVYPSGQYPTEETPKFDFARYFSVLEECQGSQRDQNPAPAFGSSLLYGEIVGSTQTLLEKNLKLASTLHNGFVCTATHQVAGRGRGKNSWISQAGCLMFSYALEHHDMKSAIFVQYLVGLSLVDAVRARPGCENLPIHLKWPNDIYARVDDGPDGLRKIGGILVTSSYQDGAFRMVIGCGVNVSNARPTTSLQELQRLHSMKLGSSKASPDLVTVEEVLARFMTQFERDYKLFADTAKSGRGFAFEPFLERYYAAWLHSDAVVSLQDHDNTRAKIVGIDSGGLLRAVTVADDHSEAESTYAREYLLQPDGNSFDMMKGLIMRKK